MKKILITGKTSYIGESFFNWISKDPYAYNVEKICMRGDGWRKKEFCVYDVVIHAAGIAHIKETKYNREIYYSINRDLAYETALKAKQDGVRQFIFLSSMSIYGVEHGVIDIHTDANPNSAYGRSKFEAEELIKKLQDESFKVAILRPPMVYGKNCKGNYTKLSKIAKLTPVFPYINNKRSMIYIDNLSECIRKIIDIESYGIFHPQNMEYVNTSTLVELIAKSHRRKIKMVPFFNPLINKFKKGIINKVFGNLTYEKSMSEYTFDYRVYKFVDTIRLTEE